MELTRRVARDLVKEGRLEILQKGKVVDDPRGFKGPIRLRLRAMKKGTGTGKAKAAVPSEEEEEQSGAELLE